MVAAIFSFIQSSETGLFALTMNPDPAAAAPSVPYYFVIWALIAISS
jgi:hypothetical protein